MQLRRRLLHLLSDGQFHSGEALGAELGVSRMAVWKHLKAVRELGVEFEIVRGRGYRLPASLELLDHAAILAGSDAGTRAAVAAIDVLLEVDSTNNRLREQALQGAPAGSVCLAEMQHAGRGRRGRSWASPFAANLYLSLLWRSTAGAASLGGLSLVTGIAVLRSLRDFGVDSAGLKWPNDILADGAKLAGVLIDVVGESSGPCAVIIGVGINVAMPPSAAGRIDQSWIDLQTITGRADISRNHLAARLLDHVLPAVAEFEAGGLQPFLEEWHRHDVVDGRHIDLHLSNQVIRGRACGIDAGGALLVDTPAGLRRFASGEVSVRMTP
jgi:BirA family biotin operon repressor/biotin-[acetyl-CoA-carboxylase] ligase